MNGRGATLMRRRHCPHSRLRGIYGDEINHTPGGRRLECQDCGALLDGPVVIERIRSDEPRLLIEDSRRRGDGA
jgi:hypothetical protein